jgi:tetratricopeptide (TPR) repeat protein
VTPSLEDLAALEPRCAALWERRSRLARLRDVARDDLRDLAVLGADLHVRVAPEGPTAARRRALAMLDEAEVVFRETHESHIFHRERERYARDLGLDKEADLASRRAAARPPRTSWEYHALGLDWLRRSGDGVLGQVPRAAAYLALRRAVALEPGELWPNFHLGQSAYANGRFQESVTAFSVCVGVDPRWAPAYLNRALAYAARGDEEQALADLERACKLDPTLSTRSAAVWYNLAVAALANNDRPQAQRHLRRILNEDPSHAAARALQERLGGKSP